MRRHRLFQFSGQPELSSDQDRRGAASSLCPAGCASAALLKCAVDMLDEPERAGRGTAGPFPGTGCWQGVVCLPGAGSRPDVACLSGQDGPPCRDCLLSNGAPSGMACPPATGAPGYEEPYCDPLALVGACRKAVAPGWPTPAGARAAASSAEEKSRQCRPMFFQGRSPSARLTELTANPAAPRPHRIWRAPATALPGHGSRGRRPCSCCRRSRSFPDRHNCRP